MEREAVRDVRERWNITPRVQLPPEDALEFEGRQKRGEYAFQWKEEVSSIRAKLDLGPTLPTQELSDYHQEHSWNEFLTACVLYDPPDDQLGQARARRHRKTQPPLFVNGAQSPNTSDSDRRMCEFSLLIRGI
jgi:hypothetical protein